MAFDAQMLETTLRRDKAIKSLQKSTSAVKPTVKGDAQRLVGKAKYLAESNSIKEWIQAHPFIATSAALCAGVLTSKIMTVCAKNVPHEPQHVIIELNHSGTRSPAPSPSRSFSFTDFVQNAIAGFQQLMATVSHLQNAGEKGDKGNVDLL